MSRVPLVNPANASGDSKALLSEIHGAFGATPNMFRAVANSPAALRSMWGAFGALGGGVLGAALGEKIAVAVADRNHCEYCLAAHTALGQKAGATAQEMSEAQAGRAQDPQTAAALSFALKLVRPRPGQRCRCGATARGRLQRRADRRDSGARGAEPVHQLRERGLRRASRFPENQAAHSCLTVWIKPHARQPAGRGPRASVISLA